MPVRFGRWLAWGPQELRAATEAPLEGRPTLARKGRGGIRPRAMRQWRHLSRAPAIDHRTAVLQCALDIHLAHTSSRSPCRELAELDGMPLSGIAALAASSTSRHQPDRGELPSIRRSAAYRNRPLKIWCFRGGGRFPLPAPLTCGESLRVFRLKIDRSDLPGG